ncbi:hypothetical protein [Hydrogenobaculum acidophilum]
MRKKLIILGIFSLVLAGCSHQAKNNQNTSTSQSPEKPPQAISCKDYCKEQCQGLTQNCETDCLNACYPKP